MANVLADKDIRRLLGSVLTDADPARINPNGIELRLGKNVLFHSTGEEKQISPGLYLRVSPGEAVSIASIEKIDFRAPAVQKLFPECMLMGLITPTTTMMREGISQVATKIDAGFWGDLNWGLRNNSTKDLILQYGEPIFKLTVFRLGADETPDVPYGEGESDHYQGSDGIVRSARKLPADIPKNKIVGSSFDKLDPKAALREAGYPYNHIGTELTDLHGKFVVVSNSVEALKQDIANRTSELTTKIDTETRTLTDKLEESKKTLLDRVELLFQRKFGQVASVIIGGISLMYGGIQLLREKAALGPSSVAYIAAVAGIAILAISYIITHKADRSPQ